MGIWAKLFGSNEVLTEGVRAVRDGLDALVYTEEEKAEDFADQRQQSLNVLLDWLRSTTGSRVARRFIAISVTLTWLSMHIIGAILATISPWFDMQDKFLTSARLLGEYSESMNGAVMLVMAFYFAAPHMGEIVKGAIDKFGTKPKV